MKIEEINSKNLAELYKELKKLYKSKIDSDLSSYVGKGTSLKERKDSKKSIARIKTAINSKKIK